MVKTIKKLCENFLFKKKKKKKKKERQTDRKKKEKKEKKKEKVQQKLQYVQTEKTSDTNIIKLRQMSYLGGD
jgi:hypothetical protein